MDTLHTFFLIFAAVFVESAVADISDGKLPVVINTWPFVDANTEGKVW